MPVAVKELKGREGTLRDRIVAFLSTKKGMAFSPIELMDEFKAPRQSVYSALTASMDRDGVERMRQGKLYRYYVKEA